MPAADLRMLALDGSGVRALSVDRDAQQALRLHAPVGSIAGYRAHVTLFSETKQAIAVLKTSYALNADSGHINDLMVKALLDNLDNAHNHTELATVTAARLARHDEYGADYILTLEVSAETGTS
ncbi:hypothetical protein VTI74DRAFT_9433 [Chaetomium olivicolor]